MAAENRFAFHAEWIDPNASLVRRYMLTYYVRDNSIEMYDVKSHRPFLKRSVYADVSLKDLYLGANVTICARQLKIIDYADAYTRRVLEENKACTLALVKPDAYNHVGTVLTAVNRAKFVVKKLQMIKLTTQQAHEFLSLQDTDGDIAAHAAFLASDVLVAMELVGNNAVPSLNDLVGPEDPAQARDEAPNSLRACIGTDALRNAVHASRDPSAAKAELEFFFGANRTWQTTALFNNCTLCIVRPHAFPNAGEIVTRILKEGFEISAMRQWCMDKTTAEEFLDVYKGVLPEFQEGIMQLCSGPALVMEVRQEEAVNCFRNLVGPADPEVAKHLRPNTLRSEFGVDRVRNAVHCTDLPEDGLLETEYFFNALYNRR